MRKLKTVLIATCIAALAAFGLAGCSALGSEYHPSLKEAEVSTPAIAEDGILRVGVNTNNSPMAGLSGEKIIGIDVDIAGAIGDDLGLKVELQDIGADTKVAIDENKVDIVMGVDKESAEDGIWLSSEYMPSGITLFALESSDKAAPATSDNVKIGAQISSKSAWAITNTFGEQKLVSETDLANAFQALQSGEVDYVASEAVVGMYAANRQNVQVKPVAQLGSATGYCVAAKKNDADLTQAVSSTLSDMEKEGVLDVIERKWLDNVVNISDLPKLNAGKSAK